MSEIQKKVSMVGVFGTGKTSLVRQFVHSQFSEKYHSTIGVKVDRKVVSLGQTTVRLLLWDIAGRTEEEEVHSRYLSGSSGILFVVDGTRRETLDQLGELQTLAHREAGPVPAAVALNKHDLREQWVLGSREVKQLKKNGAHPFLTSARSGEGVEEAFLWLAQQMTQGVA